MQTCQSKVDNSPVRCWADEQQGKMGHKLDMCPGHNLPGMGCPLVTPHQHHSFKQTSTEPSSVFVSSVTGPY
jgi:hypothetical protein